MMSRRYTQDDFPEIGELEIEPVEGEEARIALINSATDEDLEVDAGDFVRLCQLVADGRIDL